MMQTEPTTRTHLGPAWPHTKFRLTVEKLVKARKKLYKDPEIIVREVNEYLVFVEEIGHTHWSMDDALQAGLNRQHYGSSYNNRDLIPKHYWKSTWGAWHNWARKSKPEVETPKQSPVFQFCPWCGKGLSHDTLN